MSTGTADRTAARALVLRLLEREFGEPESATWPPDQSPGESSGPTDRQHASRHAADTGSHDRGELPIAGAGNPISVRTVRLTPHQTDAVRRSQRILHERGGVLIADSVGLGKTMIAIALVEAALQQRAMRIVVTSPAALRSHWWRLLRQVAREHGCSLTGLHGVVRSGPCIGWLSHAALSLGRWPAGIEPADLVVVDEAHAMRNPLTRRYRALAGLCRPARVVLLTATPVNNSLLDLYWQLRLFLGDDALADLGIADLRTAFRHALVTARLEAPLDAAVAAVMVKRTRAVLANIAGALSTRTLDGSVTLRFPRRAPPRAVRYDSDAVVPGFFGEVGERIAALRLAPFRVSLSAPAGASRAPVELMRFALLKRLESSVASFASSLASLAGYLDAFADAANAGMLLDRVVHRGAAGRDSDQLLLGHLALRPLPPGENGSDLAVTARADGSQCRELLALVRPLLDVDPKLIALEKLLDGPLAGRRTLVFTEFRDTAIQLWQRLRHRFRIALIHGGGACIGGLPAGRAETVCRFAPLANGRAPPPAAERIDVLIATDVLAEGFNLQDAADVVSYDLPWNPVRLIQRAGRIDRLGSQHDVINTWNFLPAGGLDALLGLLARVSIKLAAIRALGREPSVFGGAHRHRPREPRLSSNREWQRPPTTPETGTEAVARRIAAADPGLFDDLERQSDGPFAIVEHARAVWTRWRYSGFPSSRVVNAPGAAVAVPRLAVWEPTVLALQRPAGEPRRTIVVIETGAGKPLRWIMVGADGAAIEDRITSLSVIASVLDDDTGGDAVNGQLAIDHGAAAVAAAIALGVVHIGRLDRQLAQRHRSRRLRQVVLRALAREPGGPDVTLCDRADALMQRTVEGSRAGVEHEIREVVRTWRARPARQRRARTLLLELEAALANRNGDAGPGVQPGPRVVAILQLVPVPLSLLE